MTDRSPTTSRFAPPLFFVIIFYLLSFLINPENGAEPNTKHILAPSSWSHWLGTDTLGRDLLSRTLQGARLSLIIASSSALCSVLIGLTYGALAGWVGGVCDRIMVRTLDVLTALPNLIWIILICLVMSDASWPPDPNQRIIIGIFLALSLSHWFNVARVIRALVATHKHRPYLLAARAMGLGLPRILIVHLLPNLIGPLGVLFTYQIASNMLAEGFLSFLGLGVHPPNTTLGLLIAENWGLLPYHPQSLLLPVLVLALLTLPLSLWLERSNWPL